MSLTAPPVVLKFKGSKEADLLRALERADRTSEVVSIGSVSDLILGPDGTFGNGFKPTAWGLYQLCSNICPGMYRFIDELASLAEDQKAGLAAACEIFNRAVRLRFREALCNHVWLLDRQYNTVEAVVSTKYKFLSNLRTYDMIKGALGETGMRFQEAELRGRWLLLRFYHPKKLFTVTEQRFFAGLHFSNHEGGQSSLHASATVIRDGGNLAFATRPIRERHVGESLDRRLQQMLQAVVTYKTEPAALETGVKVLMAQPLNLGQPSEEAEDKRRKELVLQLSNKDRLHRSLSTRILAGAITQPHDATEPRLPLAISRNDLKCLTAWDLTISLCREAKALPISGREKAEQLAHALLTGRVKLR